MPRPKSTLVSLDDTPYYHVGLMPMAKRVYTLQDSSGIRMLYKRTVVPAELPERTV